jgi:hypothetical protein
MRKCPAPRPWAPAFAVGLALLLVSVVAAPGQDPRPRDDDRAGRLEAMRRLARQFPKVTGRGPAGGDYPLRADPLHRWNDPTRAFSDGTLWTFGGPGRPAAAMTIEFYPKGESVAMWSFEFVSLSAGPIAAEGGEGFERGPGDRTPLGPDGKVRWTPQARGVAFEDVAGAPAPASNRADRLRQMKAIIERFSAREAFGEPVRSYELRALPRPIDRYADPAGAILDGAIFLFVNGTNPELMLLVEAQGSEAGPATWRFAPARLGQADLWVDLDRRQVWTTPAVRRADPEQSYFNARKPDGDR